MLKVLHYIPGFSYGGIESMFLSWYKCINQDDVRFELLMRTQDDNSSALNNYKMMNGVYYRLPLIDFKHILDFKKAVELFFEEHHDYDILHVHEADPFIMSSAKKYGISKIIIHSHTTSYGNGYKAFLRRLCEQISMKRHADYAFACSEIAADWKYKGQQFKGKPVTIIHNAISSELYSFNVNKRREIRKNLGIEDYFVVGHVGRLCPPKNQFYLLDIFSELNKINSKIILLMIGDGPDESALIKYAGELGIREKVLFLGLRNDVSDLLQAMDIFLLPSRYEGLPVTLIEAQVSGLLCYISDAISKEADITDLIVRLSIELHPQRWAELINEKQLQIRDRKDQSSCAFLNGYDVKFEVQKMLTVYRTVKEKR